MKIRLAVMAAAAAVLPAVATAQEPWFIVTGDNTCAEAYRQLATLRVTAGPDLTPQQFAQALERASGMEARLT